MVIFRSEDRNRFMWEKDYKSERISWKLVGQTVERYSSSKLSYLQTITCGIREGSLIKLVPRTVMLKVQNIHFIHHLYS